MATFQRGKLRHRVRIERWADVTDTAGTVEQDSSTGVITQAWQLVREVWCEIRPLSAREFLAGAQMQSKVSAIIVMEYRNDIDATMRIVHGTTYYQIEGVIPDPQSGREWMTVPVSYGTNKG